MKTTVAFFGQLAMNMLGFVFMFWIVALIARIFIQTIQWITGP